MDIVDEAIVFAVKAHSGAKRKGSDIPYIVHPLEALAIAATVTADREVLAAAVLHDTVEDTDTTLGDIKRAFGERVAALVACESENKREDMPAADTWKTRKTETIEQLATADTPELIITLADKLSNIRAIYRDYNALGDGLWSRFNQKDKAMHGWYYKSIAEALKPLKNTEAYKEFVRLVEAVFGDIY